MPLTMKERVIGTLAQAGKPMTTRQLARKMRTEPNTLGAVLSKLHYYGQLDRERGSPAQPNVTLEYRWSPKLLAAP